MKRIIGRILALCLLAALTACSTGGYEPSNLGWEVPPEGKTMRASSAHPEWKDTNGDARIVAPGTTLEMGDLEGPGRITHMWFTVASTNQEFPRSAVLRIYYDGSDTPAVESPLGDFFAVGHGMFRNLNSAAVSIASEGRAYNCWWPMPFRESARVTVSNDHPDQALTIFWYIDWQKVDAMPEDTPYFHAQYRQEYPCVSGRDYLICETEGSGHYVGTVLSVRMREPSWFGEGDDRFYIDGAEVPQLKGTGTEDYFSDAWGFREYNRPYHGVSIWEGYEAGDRGTAYRWHLVDPIRFEESLKVTIEHKGARLDPETLQMVSGFVERPDDFSSVAFWYQTGEATRFGEVPAHDERMASGFVVDLETQLDPANLPEGILIQPGPQWSQGAQILHRGLQPGDAFSVAFPVEETGEYVVQLVHTKSYDFGIFDVYLDGQQVAGGVDLYNPEVIVEDMRLVHDTVEAGEHTLRFVCKGSNPLSRQRQNAGPGTLLGIDAVRLEKMD